MGSIGKLAGLFFILCGSGALAQPAETPPAEAGSTFVDSTGCAWQRVEIGDQVAWAALIGGDGAQMCNLAPTIVATPTPPAGVAEDTAPPASGASSAAATKATVSDAAGTSPGKSYAKRMPKRPNFPTNDYYVQIGAFAEQANADRAVAYLQEQKFGALRAQYRGRKPLQVVYAGPFESRAAADAARRASRHVGYRDAFIWEPR